MVLREAAMGLEATADFCISMAISDLDGSAVSGFHWRPSWETYRRISIPPIGPELEIGHTRAAVEASTAALLG